MEVDDGTREDKEEKVRLLEEGLDEIITINHLGFWPSKGLETNQLNKNLFVSQFFNRRDKDKVPEQDSGGPNLKIRGKKSKWGVHSTKKIPNPK
ncbi:unnamed protein product [Dovyalis caffra]|uniref:Uncharacterized protein n=1 Tax=Dovyalis caffra TaxID=77055 RepID=A0AAV1RZN8_9ROSI|nr:unnamed protein product [Dovyalis caffra]